MTELIVLAVGAGAGGIVGFFGKELVTKGAIISAQEKADIITQDAQAHARTLELEARDKALKIISDAKNETEHRHRKIDTLEEKLEKRDDLIRQREDQVLAEQRALKIREENLQESVKDYEIRHNELISQAEHVAKMTRSDAKNLVISSIEAEAEESAQLRLQKIESDLKMRSGEISRDILGFAIGKYTHEVAVEKMVTMVELPNDDIKGRIIGKEGRNINAFEKFAGVDVIIDDTPNVVIISGYDLYRRYIAKTAMESLVKDGRIHPTRIEDALNKARKAADRLTQDLGQDAARELGITGVPQELLHIVGKLNYRTSYGQNQLQHAKEVAFLAATIADEIGADVDICKKGGLLHDIGKVVSHEISGQHAGIGGAMGKKFNLDPRIINCIEAHHEDVAFTCVEAAIVQAADAVSAARPGARSEKLDNFIQRLQQIEKICIEKDGVSGAYAIQAGREVRILVRPEEVSDTDCYKLAREVAKDIEKEVEYPGTVKVQVIRESRVVEFAK